MSLLPRLRRPTGRTRLWLGTVLALAIALRLLVPQGWMPAPGGGLMICGGQTVMAHAAGHHMPVKPVEDHGCPFAALGLAATPPMPIAGAVVPPVATATAPAPVAAVAVGHGLAAPPPPATGPPAFA